MFRALRLALPLAALALCTACVQKQDVARDAQIHVLAQQAFDQGRYARTRSLIAQADRCYVPQAELWRRTLELRLALAAGSAQGEIRRLFVAWGEQRSDWSTAERADAALALAEALNPVFARDFLREEDPATWPDAQRTRYNLLMTRLQQGQSALRDDTVAHWRLAINGLYEAGDLAGAAREARRCADATHDPQAERLAERYEAELRAP